MKTLDIRLCAACIALAFAFDASAARPRSRQMEGSMEAVKIQGNELTLRSTDGAYESFVWTKQTKFIQDNQLAEPASLKTGGIVQINYRSPFFGPKFVTKVKWNSSPGR